MKTENALLKKFSQSMFLFVLMFLSYSAYAIKVDTHIWAAQQVINELEAKNGYIDIELNNGEIRSFRIDDEIKNSILANKGVFRMGSVGPDGLPDIFTGQYVVHPGQPDDETGWQTDDWLKFLLASKNQKLFTPKDEKVSDPNFSCSDGYDKNGNLTGFCEQPVGDQPMTAAQRAFVYGYLNHAAVDVFTHTYVNTYSGGIFSLSDGASIFDSTVEEVRHLELEKYIASYQPPIEDVNGNFIGTPDQLLQLPVEFLRNRLIFNDAVAERNRKGGAVYLSLIHELRKYLVGQLDDTFDDMDIYAAQAIVSAFTEGAVNMTDEQAAKFVEYWRIVHVLLNEYDGTEQLRDAYNTFGEGLKDIVELAAEQETRLNQLLSDMLSISKQLDDILLQILSVEMEMASLFEQGLAVHCEVVTKLCYDPLCKAVNEWVCTNTSAYNNLLSMKSTLLYQKNAIDAELQKIIDDRQKMVDEYTIIVMNSIDLNLEIFNGVFDTMKAMFAGDINFIRAHRDNWVKDIELAMDSYINTNSEMIKASMRGENPLDLLRQWHDCWMWTFAGVHSTATNSICRATNYAQEIIEAFESIHDTLMSYDPVYREVTKMKEEFIAKAKAKGEEIAINMIGPDAEALKVIFDTFVEPASDARLTNTFAVDASDNGNKKLLEIPDVVSRVQLDMGVYTRHDGKRVFDKDKFTAIKNAVTLAKLTLLSPEQLNSLAGKASFATDGTEPVNVLVGAIKSIDGNHQWMRTAPPLPRRIMPGETLLPSYFSDYYNVGWPEDYVYGYSANDRVNDLKPGFVYWDDCELRNTVFRQIFSGPLLPSIETPQDFGLASIVHATYPYKATQDDPFPDTSYNFNRACGPDIAVKKLDVVKNSNNTYDITVAIANVGDEAIPRGVRVPTSIYLSKDQVWDPGDEELMAGMFVRSTGLDISGVYELSGTVKLLPTIPSGEYYVIAVANMDGIVNEIDLPNHVNGNNLGVSHGVVQHRSPIGGKRK